MCRRLTASGWQTSSWIPAKSIQYSTECHAKCVCVCVIIEKAKRKSYNIFASVFILLHASKSGRWKCDWKRRRIIRNTIQWQRDWEVRKRKGKIGNRQGKKWKLCMYAIYTNNNIASICIWMKFMNNINRHAMLPFHFASIHLVRPSNETMNHQKQRVCK